MRTSWFKIYITLYLGSCFSLETTYPLWTADFSKILHVFVVSLGTLQTLPLILENSSFPCIIAVFLNKMLKEVKAIFML